MVILLRIWAAHGLYRLLSTPRLIGLDFASGLDKAKGLQPWSPIAEHLARGETGMASGKGFYEWPPKRGKQFLCGTTANSSADAARISNGGDLKV